MKIEQIYTGCLAQGAYYIVSDGEAVVIDPLREIKPYLQRAKKDGARIKYVLETHFHADFVSGHVDLARASGATIVYGPGANPDFAAHIAQDGELLSFGKLQLRVLHTPGHTMESSCYLLIDEKGRETALFTGDTLFIGDVGRPDLAQKAAHLTQDELAGILYDSLRSKIMPLPDDLVIYPAHGAGSACGKNMSTETTDTLGHQKLNNYALRKDMSREEFIREVTAGLLPPPAYFPLNVKMNRQGNDSIDLVMERGHHALDPDAFEKAANETGALVLDTRRPETFSHGFIPNSINIGIDGSFAPWVGTLIPDVKQQLLLVTTPGQVTEAITRLARVGYDYTIGYLDGGFAAWKHAGKEIDKIPGITAAELGTLIENQNLQVLDVRRESEFAAGHLSGARNIPLDTINEQMEGLDKSATYYVHCESGYRSMVFNSILRARGFENLVDIKGGYKAIKKQGELTIE